MTFKDPLNYSMKEAVKQVSTVALVRVRANEKNTIKINVGGDANISNSDPIKLFVNIARAKWNYC